MKKSLVTILLLTACSNNISNERDQLLQPLKEEAVELCLQNNHKPSLYRNEKYNSWVSFRKDKLLELFECKPGSIKWICEEREFQNSYILRERKHDDSCENNSFDLKKLNYSQKFDYLQIINGKGIYSYYNFKQ